MKVLLTIATLAVLLASGSGYYGYLHTQYAVALEHSEKNSAKRQYALAIKEIDRLRNEWWYQPVKMYPPMDILEIDKHLDYQKGTLEIGMVKLDDSLVLLNECAEAKDAKLAGDCLYQQANVAMYRGNIKTAEKKWQEAQEKYPGGHDHYTQINLELLKNNQKKAAGMAMRAGSILSHRRSSGPYKPPRQGGMHDGTIKP